MTDKKINVVDMAASGRAERTAEELRDIIRRGQARYKTGSVAPPPQSQSTELDQLDLGDLEQEEERSFDVFWLAVLGGFFGSLTAGLLVELVKYLISTQV